MPASTAPGAADVSRFDLLARRPCACPGHHSGSGSPGSHYRSGILSSGCQRRRISSRRSHRSWAPVFGRVLANAVSASACYEKRLTPLRHGLLAELISYTSQCPQAVHRGGVVQQCDVIKGWWAESCSAKSDAGYWIGGHFLLL
jgi:hypothetical protein